MISIYLVITASNKKNGSLKSDPLMWWSLMWFIMWCKTRLIMILMHDPNRSFRRSRCIQYLWKKLRWSGIGKMIFVTSAIHNQTLTVYFNCDKYDSFNWIPCPMKLIFCTGIKTHRDLRQIVKWTRDRFHCKSHGLLCLGDSKLMDLVRLGDSKLLDTFSNKFFLSILPLITLKKSCLKPKTNRVVIEGSYLIFIDHRTAEYGYLVSLFNLQTE